MDKKNLPFSILLAVTLVVTGFMVFYNLYLRESFAVTVRYNYPGVYRSGTFLPEGSDIADADLELNSKLDSTPAIAYMEPDNYDEYDEGDSYWDESENNYVEVYFPLDLNQATVEALKFIPGVGDVTAQRITQYRDYLGGYTELEQLMEIKGIGEKTFANIAPYLYVDETDGYEEE